jgi:outer membrane biosynthesis protein TonB
MRIRRRILNKESSASEQTHFFKKRVEKGSENQRPGFFGGSVVQAKTEMSKPGDRSELQADAVAARVVNSPGPIQAKAGDDVPAAIHRAKDEEKTAKKDIQKKEEDKVKKKGDEDKVKKKEEDKKMQKKDEKDKVSKKEDEKKTQKKEDEKKQAKLIQPKAEERATNNFNTRMEAAKSGGFPIPEKIRKEMETRFNLSFSDVKIHTDDEAAALCQEINAQAFTNGYHIFFNSGKYNPESSAGKLLLAHELTHVVQQMG